MESFRTHQLYIVRTHQQSIEHRSSIEKTLQLRKPPEIFVSALVEHIFFHLEHFVQFDEAIAISNDIAFSQWAKEAIEKKIRLLIFQ